MDPEQDPFSGPVTSTNIRMVRAEVPNGPILRASGSHGGSLQVVFPDEKNFFHENVRDQLENLSRHLKQI